MFKCLNPSALGIKLTQRELIELTLTYKFQHLSLDLPAFSARVEQEGLDRVRRQTESAKLQYGMFELPIDWDVDDAQFLTNLNSMLPQAKLAKELGCTHCTTRVRPDCQQRPYHENFDFQQRRLSDIGNVLGQLGIHLAIGFYASDEHQKPMTNHFIREFGSMTKLVEMINRPTVQLLVDLWDLHVGGGSIEDLKSLKPGQVGVVYAADLPDDDQPVRHLKDAERCLPGSTGRIDLTEAVRAIRTTGFDGLIVPTASRQSCGRMSNDKIVGNAAKAIDEAIKASSEASV